MSISINKLTNANVYVDGASLLGRAEEINLPVIKHKMVDHKALGMVGTAEFFAGIDKMEAKIKWNSFYSDVLKKAADPMTPVQLQVRSSLENWGSSGRQSEKACVAYITASYKDFPGGNFKQHDNVEAESNLSVYYYKLEIDGQVIVEIDVLANIYKVDGVDKLATYRANLGI